LETDFIKKYTEQTLLNKNVNIPLKLSNFSEIYIPKD